MSSLVSVIIPVYNAEKFLKRCIDSVLNQSYSNIEIILVDDCSTDSSRLIMDYYAKHFKNIVAIYNEERLYLGGARNDRSAHRAEVLAGVIGANDTILTILINLIAGVIQHGLHNTNLILTRRAGLGQTILNLLHEILNRFTHCGFLLKIIIYLYMKSRV